MSAVGASFTDIDMPGSMYDLALIGHVAERRPDLRLVVEGSDRPDALLGKAR